MNDEIFQSMLHSSRRIKEITVCAGPDEVMARRLGIVLAKFKDHATKLEVVSPFSLISLRLPIMDAISEMKELSLSWNDTIDVDITIPIREGFNKYEKIPDNSLEALKIQSEMPTEMPTSIRQTVHRQPNQAGLQNFVNRQMKLKKLVIPTNIRLNLNHLALEELTMSIGHDEELAAILQQQQKLRVFLGGSIGSAAFNELCRMPKLEVLRGYSTENMAGELKNLKELLVAGWQGCRQIIRDEVALPALITFKLYERQGRQGQPSGLGTEQVVTLSHIAPKLQKIALRTNRQRLPTSTYLPTILDSFTELKSLRLEQILDGYRFPPPTRKNLSLTELVIHRQGLHEIYYDADEYYFSLINWCPNLERISLHDIVSTKHAILNLILQRQPHLTHFSFGFEHKTDFFNENTVESLDLTMKTIINVFRNSPHFVSLRLYPMPEFATQLIEEALAVDAARIRVTKFNAYQLCGFALSKKVDDPFKRFNSYQISDDFCEMFQ